MKQDFKTYAFGVGGTAVTAVLTAFQYDEMLKWINLILSIVTALVTIAYTIYRWYKRAKKDGKVTIDEVGELLDEVHTELDKTKENLDKGEKKDENDRSAREGD